MPSDEDELANIWSHLRSAFRADLRDLGRHREDHELWALVVADLLDRFDWSDEEVDETLTHLLNWAERHPEIAYR